MMGNSFGKLGDAYTDVEHLKEYLLMESSKFVRWGLGFRAKHSPNYANFVKKIAFYAKMQKK